MSKKQSRIDKMVKDQQERDQAIFWCIQEIKKLQTILEGAKIGDPMEEEVIFETIPKDEV